MSTETKLEETEDTGAQDDTMFCKVDDVKNFLEQVSISLLSIVNGINSSMEELTKRSNNSDDNED